MIDYGKNPPKLEVTRKIPLHHYSQVLSKHTENISFLPGISVDLNQNIEGCMTVKTTSVKLEKSKLKQLSACFDISCKPLGSTLSKPLSIKLQKDQIGHFNSDTIILYAYDTNTRTWNELTTCVEETDIVAKVQFFGKFVFCHKPSIYQIVLTDVAAEHVLHETDAFRYRLTVKDDVIDKYHATFNMVIKHINKDMD